MSFASVSVDELRRRYGPARVVGPHGECIVVPHDEFLPSWELPLANVGFKVVPYIFPNGRHQEFLDHQHADKSGKAMVPPKEVL